MSEPDFTQAVPLTAGYITSIDGKPHHRIGGQWVPQEQVERLADLPADLQAIAAEFLTLHDAWGTEFEASNHLWKQGNSHSTLAVKWRQKGASSAFLWRTAGMPHFCDYWELVWSENKRESKVRDLSHTLRRSADFAEFVQRFKGVE